jgi:hypothetical protein
MLYLHRWTGTYVSAFVCTGCPVSCIALPTLFFNLVTKCDPILWSPNEGFSGGENKGNLENVPKKARRRRRRRPCPPQAFAGELSSRRAHGKVEFACSRAAGMQSPAAPRIGPGGTLSGTGDAPACDAGPLQACALCLGLLLLLADSSGHWNVLAACYV